MDRRRVRSGFCIIALAWPLIAAAPVDSPEHFESPDAAVAALVAAVKESGTTHLTALFGEDGMAIVDSGDPVENQGYRAKFLAAYDAQHRIDTSGDMAILSIGPKDWPFPIPIAHTEHGWSFDVAAGEEEILARRIGSNELYVQQVMLAYADAQNEYAQTTHDGIKVHAYAQRLMSTPGKHDGLYWPTEAGQPESPLGALVADAQASGYRPGQNIQPQPFHGYFFHVLKAQGPHAPGGAYDYMADGVMIGGYGLVAWPAQWGNSGVMTFMLNQDGELYQADLGPRTAEIAHSMTRFDPDAAWQKIGAPAPFPDEASEGDGD